MMHVAAQGLIIGNRTIQRCALCGRCMIDSTNKPTPFDTGKFIRVNDDGSEEICTDQENLSNDSCYHGLSDNEM
jgi:hypothetical protein